MSNSIHAVCALQQAPGAAVELAGGTVRMRDLDVIGAHALEFFANHRVDFALFSCGGLSKAGQVMDYNVDEITARKAIATCGKKRILVMDSTKNGLELACQAGHVWDVDVIVSGAKLSSSVVDNCARNNCQIIQV